MTTVPEHRTELSLALAELAELRELLVRLLEFDDATEDRAATAPAADPAPLSTSDSPGELPGERAIALRNRLAHGGPPAITRRAG